MTTPIKQTNGVREQTPPSTPLRQSVIDLFGTKITSISNRGSNPLQTAKALASSEKISLPDSEQELCCQINEALSQQNNSPSLFNLLESLIPEASAPAKIMGRSICSREIGKLYSRDILLHRHFIAEAYNDLNIAYELTNLEKDDDVKMTLFFCLMNQYEEIEKHMESPSNISKAQEKYLLCQNGLERAIENLDRKAKISKLKIFKIFTSSLGVLLLVIYSRKVLKNYRIQKLS